MKILQKNMKLLICLFIYGQSVFTMERETKNIVSLYAGLSTSFLVATKYKFMSGFGALELGRFVAYSLAIILPEKQSDVFLKQTFFAADEWYKDLAKKYPQAYLDAKKFEEGSQWASSYNAIKYEEIDFCDISEIYDKQKKGDILSKQEVQLLAECEAIILHEAGHIEYNHHISHVLLDATIATALESLYQNYKKKLLQVAAPKVPFEHAIKSMPKQIGIFSSMATVHVLMSCAYSRHCEYQADAFACKHADLPALRGYAQLFEKQISVEKKIKENDCFNQNFTEIIATHPTEQKRLDKVIEEIARRELAKIK